MLYSLEQSSTLFENTNIRLWLEFILKLNEKSLAIEVRFLLTNHNSQVASANLRLVLSSLQNPWIESKYFTWRDSIVRRNKFWAWYVISAKFIISFWNKSEQTFWAKGNSPYACCVVWGRKGITSVSKTVRIGNLRVKR